MSEETVGNVRSGTKGECEWVSFPSRHTSSPYVHSTSVHVARRAGQRPMNGVDVVRWRVVRSEEKWDGTWETDHATPHFTSLGLVSSRQSFAPYGPSSLRVTRTERGERSETREGPWARFRVAKGRERVRRNGSSHHLLTTRRPLTRAGRVKGRRKEATTVSDWRETERVTSEKTSGEPGVATRDGRSDRRERMNGPSLSTSLRATRGTKWA